jgi:transcriptional regulator with XRE-family HTH domain
VRATEDADLLKEALVENIHRVQLNPLEEAAAYQQLLEDFGVTQEELAARLGRSRPTISNTIRLLSLPSGVQRRIAAGVITAGHAKALLSLESAAAQQRLADRVVAEGLSVRATEEAARLMQGDEAQATSSSGARAAAGAVSASRSPDSSSSRTTCPTRSRRACASAWARSKGRSPSSSCPSTTSSASSASSPTGWAHPRDGGRQRAAPTEAEATSQATAAEALAQRRRVRFDDLGDLDLEGMRRATPTSATWTTERLHGPVRPSEQRLASRGRRRSRRHDARQHREPHVGLLGILEQPSSRRASRIALPLSVR